MNPMSASPRKAVVETYLEGFRRGDHATILDCLTDDVEWEMPGYFSHRGKDAFDKEIENEAFVGHPVITADRLVEEGDTVVAIGAVQGRFRTGEPLEAVFADVFTFRGDKISRLETYQVTLSPPPAAA